MIDSFFGVHPFLFRSGLWLKMKPGERDLYLFLMKESERCCTRELVTTDAEVRAEVGTASRTLCNARKKLQELGLVRYTAGLGNRYRYVICNPKTGEPYHGHPRSPIIMPRRGPVSSVRGSSERSSSQDTVESAKRLEQQELPVRSYGAPDVFR